MAIIVISALTKNAMRFGCVFTSMLTIGISFVTGIADFYELSWFLIWYAVTLIVSLAAGYANLRHGHRLYSILAGSLMTIFYFVGGVYYNRWLIVLGILVFFGMAAGYAVFRAVGSQADKVFFTC